MTAVPQIRPFRPSDQGPTRALILTGLGEYFDQIRPELNPDLTDIQASIIDREGRFFVAEADGEVVGSGGLLAEGPGTWRIVRVSVAPAYRRQGLGRRLTQHLIDTVATLGAQQIVVETNEGWIAAINLYRSCGFTIDAYRDGECHMRLSLPG